MRTLRGRVQDPAGAELGPEQKSLQLVSTNMDSAVLDGDIHAHTVLADCARSSVAGPSEHSKIQAKMKTRHRL